LRKCLGQVWREGGKADGAVGADRRSGRTRRDRPLDRRSGVSGDEGVEGSGRRGVSLPGVLWGVGLLLWLGAGTLLLYLASGRSLCLP